jgi:hypothetical protein
MIRPHVQHALNTLRHATTEGERRAVLDMCHEAEEFRAWREATRPKTGGRTADASVDAVARKVIAHAQEHVTTIKEAAAGILKTENLDVDFGAVMNRVHHLNRKPKRKAMTKKRPP